MHPSGTIVGVLASAALVAASAAVPTTGDGRVGPPAARGPAVVDAGPEITRTSMALVGARMPGQPVSLDLLLHDAEIVLLARNDPEAEPHAKLRFTSPIDEIVEEDGFFVVAANPATAVRSVAASLAEDDRTAVIVRFPPGTDLAEHTMAGAEAGAVRTVDGKGNPVTTTPLATLAGATAAPELATVTTRPDTNWITYRFTAHLAHDRRPRPERFGFYSSDGDDLQGHGNTLGVAGTGTAAPDPVHAERRIDPATFALLSASGNATPAVFVVDLDGEALVLAFPRAATASAQALTVAGAAVADRQGNPNPPSTVLRRPDPDGSG